MTFIQVLLLILFLFVLYSYGKKLFYSRYVQNYSPGEVAEKMKKSKNVILLDVRTPAEHKNQNIKGSILIPLHELNHRAKELEKYKNSEIICYCRTGSRSISAAVKLKKKGFNSANMKGGIISWNFKVST